MADVYVLMCNNKPKVRVFEKPPAPPINVLLWLLTSKNLRFFGLYKEPFFTVYIFILSN